MKQDRVRSLTHSRDGTVPPGSIGIRMHGSPPRYWHVLGGVPRNIHLNIFSPEHLYHLVPESYTKTTSIHSKRIRPPQGLTSFLHADNLCRDNGLDQCDERSWQRREFISVSAFIHSSSYAFIRVNAYLCIAGVAGEKIMVKLIKEKKSIESVLRVMVGLWWPF